MLKKQYFGKKVYLIVLLKCVNVDKKLWNTRKYFLGTRGIPVRKNFDRDIMNSYIYRRWFFHREDEKLWTKMSSFGYRCWFISYGIWRKKNCKCQSSFLLCFIVYFSPKCSSYLILWKNSARKIFNNSSCWLLFVTKFFRKYDKEKKKNVEKKMNLNGDSFILEYI